MNPEDIPHTTPAATPRSSDGWSRPNNRVRVTRACDRCKKRKVRCNGEQPCRVCAEAAATCSYSAPYTRGRRRAVRVTRIRPQDPVAITPQTQAARSNHISFSAQDGQPMPSLPVPPGQPISRASPEPPETDLEGNYVGPSSGIAFIFRAQERFERPVLFPRGLSVFNFGDAPLPYNEASYSSLDPTVPLLLDRGDTVRLVQRYFDFAVPVDRFLHRPTIGRWFDELYQTKGVMHDRDAAPARTAVLLMVFAIAQEHTVAKPSPAEADISGRYFQAANHQLSKEQGPVRLASVQARLCQCLWLLSQSRINHCWSLFGTVARLIFALGLHRNRHAYSNSMTQIEIQCRRRTFWSAYSLDNYLSTALGRPRTFNDKDIDQELPACLNDEEIHSGMDVSGPSNHELSAMYGPVSYAKLSQILSGILTDLYSIQPMSIIERFDQTGKYMNELKAWRTQMSSFLDQDISNSAPLIPIYQRQINVLNLAYWHTVILTNRPLLLTSFARLKSSTRGPRPDRNERTAHFQESINECLHAAMEIVGIVNSMIQAKQLFRAFWFTPYFAFSACVILYVHTIQHSNEPEDVYQRYFSAAERCQQQIAEIAEVGSLTSRYCLVLEELGAEAVRQMTPGHLEAHSVQLYPALETTGTELNGTSYNGGGMPAGLSASISNLVALQQLDDFHVSPSASLEDLTGWGQFESMVVSGFDGSLGL